MKMKTLFKFLLLLILFLPHFLNGQTNEEQLQDRYWSYRERFRKHFTSIGEKPGQGLVFADVNLQPSCWAHLINNTTISKDLFGKLNIGGDVTAFMAEYMGLLSSEYWLLKNKGLTGSEEMKAVQIELYFAINAMERLDLYSQRYFDRNNNDPAPIDGFFVRDDALASIRKDFAMYAYPQVEWMAGTRQQGAELLLGTGLSDYDTRRFVTTKAEENNTYQVLMVGTPQDGNQYFDEITEPEKGINEMSMDQLIGVLFGFKCIMKFVDDNLEVDPDGVGTLPKKNLKKWVKELTEAMMRHLSKRTDNIPVFTQEEINAKMKKGCERTRCNGSPCSRCDEESEWNIPAFTVNNPKLADYATYIITNPHKGGLPVSRGPYAFMYGYPLHKIGKEITGIDFPEVTVNLSNSTILKRLHAPGALFAEILETYYSGRPIQPQKPGFWREVYNAIPRNEITRNKMKKSTGSSMLIWLPAASGTWSHEEYFDLMNTYKRPAADLLWSVLNGKEPLIESNVVESTLFSSNCDGVQNTEDRYDQIFNIGSYFSKMASDGDRSDGDKNVYVHNWSDNKGDRRNEVWFNGLDWMMIYNFYRIAEIEDLKRNPGSPWKVSTQIVNDDFIQGTYKNDYCPCRSSVDFYSDRNFNPNTRIKTFNTHITALPYTPTSLHVNVGPLKLFHTAYKDYHINLSEWLTQNLTINANGTLKPQGDLTVCNSTVEIKSSGTLATTPNSNANYYKTIRFGKNSALKISNGGILRIENNTTVIIDEGAVMFYTQGARVILNGPNAVLKIAGRLLLNNNTVFKVEAGPAGRGFVHFHRDSKSDVQAPLIGVYNGSKTSSVQFEVLAVSQGPERNDKVLQITGDIGLVTDWQIKHFIIKSGFIAMGKGSKLVSNAEYTSIKNCRFNVLSNVDEDFENRHGGIEIPGRLNNFEDVEIMNGKIGIGFYNRGGQTVLNLKDVSINTRTTDYAVYQIGGAFNISDGSNLYARYGGIYAMGITGSSLLRQSTVGITVSNGSSDYVPIWYQGTGNFYLWKNDIQHGNHGLYVNGSSVRLKCNYFMDNRTHFAWDNPPNVSMYKGYNTFKSATNTHLFANGPMTYFEFKNGYNIYETPLDLGNGKLVLNMQYSGASPKISAGTQVDGANNAYGNATAAMTLTPKPTSGFNYSLFSYNNPASLFSNDLELVSTPNLRTTLSNLGGSSDCNEAHEHSNAIETFGIALSGDLIFYPRGLKRSINPDGLAWDPFSVPKKNIADIREANLPRLYSDNDSTRTDSSLTELIYVLKYNALDAALADTPDIYVMHDLFDMSYDAYAWMALKEDSATQMYGRVAPYYDSMHAMMQALWAGSKDTNGIWFMRQHAIIMNWSNVNRLAGNGDIAIAILDSGKLYTDNAVLLSTYDKMICVNQMEMALRADTSLSLDSARKMFSCFMPGLLNDDTANVEFKDTIIHYCNWDSTITGRKSYALFAPGSNFIEIKQPGNDAFYMDRQEEYELEAGQYLLSYYDTLTGLSSYTNLTVIGDTQIIEMNDTSLFYCDWNKYGIFSNVEYIPQDGFPYTVKDDSTGNYIYDNHLKSGSYTVETYDTSNCKIIRTKLIIVGDTQQVSTVDTGITSGQFTGFMSYVKFLPYAIYSRGQLYLGPLDKCFFAGEYDIERYDTNNCIVQKIHLTVSGDTLEIEIHDTTIYYCDFTDSIYASAAQYAPAYNFPYSILKIFPDTLNITQSDLVSGNYEVDYYDTLNCKIIRVNLTVLISDTAQSNVADTSISYCEVAGCVPFNPYPELGRTIFRLSPDTSVISDTCFHAGNYLINYFDHDNCSMLKINLTVISDSATIENRDTTVSFCTMCDSGLIYYPVPRLKYSILKISPDSMYTEDIFLTEGEYIIDSYDTSHCKIIRTMVTVMKDTAQIISHDTTLYHCVFDACLDYEPSSVFKYSILKTYPDTMSIDDNCLPNGEYIVNVYDTVNCRIIRTNLTVESEAADTIDMHDTLSYTCGSTKAYVADCPGVMKNAYGATVTPASPGHYTLNPVMGTYRYYCNDTESCVVNRITLKFDHLNRAISDTTHILDTLDYTCDSPTSVTFAMPCTGGRMMERNGTLIAKSNTGNYTLDPRKGFYYIICRDTGACRVYKTKLVFHDVLVVTSPSVNHKTGLYDRSYNSCCWIDVSSLICGPGSSPMMSLPVKVFNTSSVFLYGTTIAMSPYGFPGFQFCPPQWNTSSGSIHNVYDVVLQNDTCHSCRLDFSCDSSKIIISDLGSGGDEEGFKVNMNTPKGDQTGNSSWAWDSAYGPYTSAYSLSIHPNPASSVVNVSARNSNAATLTVHITDAAGKQVYKQAYNTNKGNLNAKIGLQDLQSGVYMIYIPELNYYYKLVIIH